MLDVTHIFILVVLYLHFMILLMAKLCTWGPTFDESRTKMLTALNDFYIQGVETSIPLYKTILKTEEYKNGDLSTDFLETLWNY